jgi:pantetheine-phosphate adenylyltransferase
MTRALYPLSADPFTNGHLDIIERASKIFDELWVGVGKNLDKEYLFELEDRLEMLKKGVAHLPNVKVVYYKGLLVDYA